MSPQGVPTGNVWLPDITPAGPWVARAACRGENPDMWFPLAGERGLHKAAVTICETCPVRQECLDYAVTNRIGFGIWGGLGEHRRRPLTRTAPAPRRWPMPAHGVAGRYRYGCRCDECRVANTREAARYRAAKRAG